MNIDLEELSLSDGSGSPYFWMLEGLEDSDLPTTDAEADVYLQAHAECQLASDDPDVFGGLDLPLSEAGPLAEAWLRTEYAAIARRELLALAAELLDDGREIEEQPLSDVESRYDPDGFIRRDAEAGRITDLDAYTEYMLALLAESFALIPEADERELRRYIRLTAELLS